MTAPMLPELGTKLVIVGGTVTVKITPLLVPAAVVTVTFPVIVPTGTWTVIFVFDQRVIAVAAVPLKETVEVP